MARNVYCVEFRMRILNDYLKNGLTVTELAKKYSINKSVVSRLIKKYESQGTIETIHAGGRPEKTTEKDDHLIKWCIQKDPTISANQILKKLKLPVSESTIKRRAVGFGLFSRRPARKPFLSEKNRKARLLFARSHIDWTITKWRSVLFSDESKFNLRNSDGIMFVRRPKGERLNPKYCVPTFKYGGGGNVLVWGCFSGHGIGPIHRIDGIMDRFVYVNILKNVMLPFADEEMPVKWRFQQDNDPKHTSKLAKDWFRDNKIEVLEWPAQSPDLNPIENLWEIVNKRVDRTCSNKEALFDAVKEAWNNIPEETISNLIASMPKRCSEVIRNNGMHTKY